MCTVTFIPRPTGYYLAMNRDEQLTRIAGLPPAERIIEGRTVLCPSEPGGGTWIALNDSGTSFALINWYSVEARVKKNPVSRGEVINTISSAVTLGEADARLRLLPLHGINPFRLIGVFPDICEIAEWQWDLKKILRYGHLWRSQQWVSSGFDEPTAQRVRRNTFKKALQQHSAGTLHWLRRLHRSHSPTPGPFSICMHRSDAATVSYSEISVASPHLTIRYEATVACEHGDYYTLNASSVSAEKSRSARSTQGL